MRNYALTTAVSLVGICLPIAGVAATWEHDFNNSGMGWYFGSFSGNYTTHAAYLAFDSGANEQGGSGRGFGTSNMTGAGKFSITARIGSGNAADDFVVKIYDNDATSSIHCWTFKSNCFNTTTFTTVTRYLNAPDYIEQAGTTEGLDLANMRDFYINGDYSTTDALAFDFDHIEINPAPAISMNLISTIGIWSGSPERGITLPHIRYTQTIWKSAVLLILRDMVEFPAFRI